MFDLFNYLAIVLSIVIGLGLTSTLTGLANLIKNRKTIKPYTPAILWIISVVSVLVLFWYGIWNIQIVQSWTYPLFVMQLLPAILLYMAGELAIPDFSQEDLISLESYYFDNRHWFFGTAIAYFVTDGLADTVLLNGGNWLFPENGFRLLGVFIGIVSFRSSSRRLHNIISVAAFLLLVVFVLVFSNEPMKIYN